LIEPSLKPKDTLDESPQSQQDRKPLDAELRRDLLRQLVLAVPLLLIGMSIDWLKKRFDDEPGAALWVIIPGIIFLCCLLIPITRQRLKLRWPFLLFVAVYILVFFVAAETRVLDWKRSLVGYDDVVPNNFLALNRLGDWHYWLAPATVNQDLAIVLMKPAETPSLGRIQIADLITYARESQAKGVALDFYFANSENGEALNRYLCKQLDDAKHIDQAKGQSPNSAEWPIFVGCDFRLGEDRLERVRIDPYLEYCLPEANQGHAVGYAEWDGVIRSIPLSLSRSNRSLESLSLKIAQKLVPQIKVPKNGILQFTKPVNDFKQIKWAEVWKNYEEGDEKRIEADRLELQDRFILVGEDSAKDRFPTPYGDQPGVMIHAYAVHSLSHQRYIERPRWWVSLLAISLSCYLMMVMTSRGVGNLKLILMNVVFSVSMVAIAILVIYFWLSWIDLIYPLLATWLFLLLLVGLKRIGFVKIQAARPLT